MQTPRGGGQTASLNTKSMCAYTTTQTSRANGRYDSLNEIHGIPRLARVISAQPACQHRTTPQSGSANRATTRRPRHHIIDGRCNMLIEYVIVDEGLQCGLRREDVAVEDVLQLVVISHDNNFGIHTHTQSDDNNSV